MTCRFPLGIVAFVATCMTLACQTQQSPGAAGMEGQWAYEDNCAECHEQHHPELHKQPPNLHGLFSQKTLPSGAPATDEQVRKTIVEGRNTMPAFDHRLQDKQIDELLRYLHRLQ